MEIRYNLDKTVDNRDSLRTLKILAIENSANKVEGRYIEASLLNSMISDDAGEDKLITVKDVISSVVADSDGFKTFINGGKGAQGITGVQGLTGYQGFTGLQGITGSQGLTGLQGLIGSTGRQGYRGNPGNGGEPGAQGITGSAGLIGPQGQLGFTGYQGPTGSRGIQGTTGVQGPTGINGVQGRTGAQGMIGAVGFTGQIGGCTLLSESTYMDKIFQVMSQHGISIASGGIVGISGLQGTVADKIEAAQGFFELITV